MTVSSTRLSHLLAAASFVAAFGLSANALAQDGTSSNETDDVLVIETEIPEPEASYLLLNRELTYEPPPEKRSFLDQLDDTVENTDEN